MSLPPVEIPLGAMRFNSDSQKLEYWNGSVWMQIHTSLQILMVVLVEYLVVEELLSTTNVNIIDYITISTARKRN